MGNQSVIQPTAEVANSCAWICCMTAYCCPLVVCWFYFCLLLPRFLTFVSRLLVMFVVVAHVIATLVASVVCDFLLFCLFAHVQLFVYLFAYFLEHIVCGPHQKRSFTRTFSRVQLAANKLTCIYTYIHT